MSLLKTIEPNPTFEPKQRHADPERLIAGNPVLKTWVQDTAKDGTVNTGVFEATPGETHSIKGETFEFCHIVHGVIELTEKGKEPVTYRAGDNFVLKPGYIGVWKTIETVRKIFVTVT